MQCFTSNHTLIEVLGVTGFDYGKTTAVVDAQTYKVQAVLNTGPRTNHPNFVTVDGVNYAYLTVGDLGQTLVYRRSSTGGPPTLVKRIRHHGLGPHGIWPSPDNTRMYVALQYSDAVDVIDTRSMKVIDTLRVGQSPMALVYVARTSPPAPQTSVGRAWASAIRTTPSTCKESPARETPTSGHFPESMRFTSTSGAYRRTVPSPYTPPAATTPPRC